MKVPYGPQAALPTFNNYRTTTLLTCLKGIDVSFSGSKVDEAWSRPHTSN